MIFFQHLTPIVWTSVADSGVVLTMRYICEPRRRRSTATAIWEEILTAFAAEDAIDFAYPTTRFYDNRLEGKPGTGGPLRGRAPRNSSKSIRIISVLAAHRVPRLCTVPLCTPHECGGPPCRPSVRRRCNPLLGGLEMIYNTVTHHGWFLTLFLSWSGRSAGHGPGSSAHPFRRGGRTDRPGPGSRADILAPKSWGKGMETIQGGRAQARRRQEPRRHPQGPDRGRQLASGRPSRPPTWPWSPWPSP